MCCRKTVLIFHNSAVLGSDDGVHEIIINNSVNSACLAPRCCEERDHSGHMFLKSKFHDYQGLSRKFLGKFKDMVVVISRTFPGHLKKMNIF